MTLLRASLIGKRGHLGIPNAGQISQQLSTVPRKRLCQRLKPALALQGDRSAQSGDDPVVQASETFKEAVAESPLPEKSADALSFKSLAKFCLPTLAIWLIGPCLSLVDTAVVGSKSSTDLAALGPGCILCDLNGYVFTFLAVATTNLMAISIANRDQEQANQTLSDAVVIALMFGLLFGGITYFIAPTILQAMTGAASPQLIAPASTYVKIRSFGAPAAFVMFVTSAFFLAAWDPITPLLSSAVAGVGNLVLDLFLVNVMHMGIAGAAIATVTAQVVSALMLIRATYKKMPSWSPISGWRMRIRWHLPTLSATKRFLIFAGPICFVLLTKTAMYNRLSSYSSSLGTVSSGANHITMIIFGLFAVFGDVISQAAQAFLPASIGKPKEAQSLGKKLFAAGAGVGLVNSAIGAAIILFLPWVFTNNAEVIALAARLSPLLALALSLHTSSLATEGILMAGRDLGFLVSSYLVNMALTMATLFYVRQQGIGIMGSFACLCQFQITRFVFNVVRLAKAKKSPMQSTEPLTSWITDDVKAAALS